MRIAAFFLSLALLVPGCAMAGQVRVNKEVTALVQKLAAAYKGGKEVLAKKNVSVTSFEASGDDAVKHGLGRTMRDLVSTEVSRSTVFNLVERADLEKVLREQALQLSGATDDKGAVQAGRVLNADALLFGSVAEAGENITVTAKLVDTETGAVMSETVTMPKAELVRTADALLDMAYVKKSGVGISLNVLGATMSGDDAAFTQSPSEDETAFFHRVGAEVKYRASKWLMFGAGINMLWGQTHSVKNQAWDATKVPSAPGAPSGSGTLVVEAKGVGLPLNAYLTYNATRKLNLFAAAGVELAMLNFNGYFPSAANGGGMGFGQNQHQGPTYYQEVLLGNVMLGAEYFLTPRLAISAKAGYRFGTADIEMVGVPHLTGLDGTNQEADFSGFSFLQTISVYF